MRLTLKVLLRFWKQKGQSWLKMGNLGNSGSHNGAPGGRRVPAGGSKTKRMCQLEPKGT